MKDLFRTLAAIALFGVLALAAAIICGWAIDSLRPRELDPRGSAEYLWLRKETVTVTPALGGLGTANSLTNLSDGYVRGHVYAVFVDYTNAPNTTDISLTVSAPAVTLLNKDNSATDAWYYPATQQVGNTGSAISGAYDRTFVDGQINVGVNGANLTSTITVYIYWGQ